MPIRVLVVDDSAFMRQAISKMLETEPDICVCATARSGEEAVRQAHVHHPDVVTMDVEMPGMGGLAAVREIVGGLDTPVIMVSALTQEGADITFQALEAGAVDFIAKPDAAYVNIRDVSRDLIEKVRGFASRRPRRKVPSEPPPGSAPQLSGGAQTFRCVILGTSTGGPVALSKILPALPVNFSVPVIAVQHMPAGFTRPLAERLDAACSIRVVEGQDGMAVRKGVAIIAPAGHQLSVRSLPGGGEAEVQLCAGDGTSLHVPSVDFAMASVAQTYDAGTLAVILTGMGRDGVAGLRTVKSVGGFVIGQDEASSVVYGMPRAAAAAGVVDLVLPLERIAAAICELTNSSFARS